MSRQVCQGDAQRQSVLFTLCIIECSKFLNSSTVIIKGTTFCQIIHESVWTGTAPRGTEIETSSCRDPHSNTSIPRRVRVRRIFFQKLKLLWELYTQIQHVQMLSFCRCLTYLWFIVAVWCEQFYKTDKSKVRRVQSNMQQILFSAENTVQGVFLCILTLAAISESPTTHHRSKCQKYTEGIYSLKHTNMDFTCLHIRKHNKTSLEEFTTTTTTT